MTKRFYLSIAAAIGAGLVLIGGYFYHKMRVDPLHASASLNTLESEAVKKNDAMHLAQKYVDGIPKGAVLLDDSETSAQKEIEAWRTRIEAFAKNRHQDHLNENELHTMANQTVSLFRLLKEASIRQDQGLDPYTPLSGFNTMALVMKMESEFKSKLGYTFSEFMASQDAAQIKELLKTTAKK